MKNQSLIKTRKIQNAPEGNCETEPNDKSVSLLRVCVGAEGVLRGSEC